MKTGGNGFTHALLDEHDPQSVGTKHAFPIIIQLIPITINNNLYYYYYSFIINQ